MGVETSQSKLHFGHFKANCLNPTIASFDAAMSNIPYATGYSPSHWQHGTNAELLKSENDFRVEKLRTILLYEADFNANNKLLGRSLMTNAETLSQLAPEQYGSCKSLSAIDHSLNKRLTYDLLRQKHIPGVLCANDAKSCYDRIVHSFASLAMRRVGVPEAPLVSMFTTIQNVNHYVQMAYGDSERSFGGNEWTTPVHGVGQGNGASPTIWAVVSTPVLNMMRANGFGTTFCSALNGDIINFVGYSFVDDTDLCQTAQTQGELASSVLAEMQEGLNMWEGGIRATGGAIVPEKSHWYLVDFKWRNGKWSYALVDESPGILRVKDSSGTEQILERLALSDARQTLGVRLAPDGNNKAEVEHLTSIAVRWGDRIRTGHLPRRASWLALTSTIMRQLIYPLSATTLSSQECHSILSPVLQAGLPASGISRSFPWCLVHAPLTFQGLDIPNLYTEQGILHILQIA